MKKKTDDPIYVSYEENILAYWSWLTLRAASYLLLLLLYYDMENYER